MTRPDMTIHRHGGDAWSITPHTADANAFLFLEMAIAGDDLSLTRLDIIREWAAQQGFVVQEGGRPMNRVHLNWSGCPDWFSTRAALRSVVGPHVTLYGNFADVDMEPEALKAKLEAAGFDARDTIPGPYERARFDLYRRARVA